MRNRTEELYRLFLRSPKIVTDSREKQNGGGIFFALKGERFDGNLFAAKALENGAQYAVVDNPEVVTDDCYFVVENALFALQDLARMHREKFKIPVFALTGTNGKTTTKELIRAVLSEKYETLATTGNLNNHIGVPLTLLKLTPTTQIAVIEMGANHQGEIKTLCDIALPTHGLITNIGKAHLEGFGNEEGLKKAKKELYDHLEQHGGTIFYHDTDTVLTDMLATSQATTIPYGSSCRDITPSTTPYLRIALNICRTDYDLQTQLAGAYNLENVLAAACVGNYFGVPPASVVSAIAGYLPQNNRSQIIRTERNSLLLDLYNANPASMKAALANFLERMSGNRMAILGDMFELGEASPSEHCAVMDMLVAHPEVTAAVTGKNFMQAAKHYPGVPAFEDVETLKKWLINHPPNQQTILVKASRGMKLEQILELL
ncbi:MAG: UDP-N-acetylmuramoyl-tripeptide--D-alanyl-D-alanine ligase [Bacteroidales bacterium]|jgi:UDP-N-acetylmuramoyl-tripeptide--D-alanyl-D-alanine ligase|nr:UDP-N-acetylmuramoyl-tripeptide--D-alanyl-D-alanine ligase [Bacteroidales bacterium]